MSLSQPVQFLPKGAVLNAAFGGRSPAIALPIGNPVSDPFLQISGICVEADFAGLRKRFRCLYRPSQLHLVVGGPLRTTAYLFGFSHGH